MPRNKYKVKPRVWRMWTPRGRRVFNQINDWTHVAYQEPIAWDWNVAFMAACWASDLDVRPT